MSAIGTKRTWACAPHMSAFGGKADVLRQYLVAVLAIAPAWMAVAAIFK